MDLDLDLSATEEELDVKEYEIPEVELPTLESILAESEDSDDELINLDEINEEIILNGTSGVNLNLPELNELKNWETTSIASNDSKITKEKSLSSLHGDVLSLHTLESLSRQLTSALQRINAGAPTTLKVSSMTAIGTSHGMVFLFNVSQTLLYCLGNTKIGAKYGSVTAIEFNADDTRLLIGYAKGEILMYDITNGKLLRTITDAHPPGYAVLHLKFTDDPTIAAANDSGGSVYELNFRRVMGVRSCESRCLFSGSRGEVCTMEALHLDRNIADHPLRDRHLLAMGTLTKILVVMLRPQIKILFTHRLSTNPSCVPLISWQLVVFHNNNTRTIDPVLMFGRGDVVYFFQLKSEGYDTLNFLHLRTMNLTYKLINMAWLNSRTVAMLDSKEYLHVVDVDSQECLENKPMDKIKLIYNSATFKSIATGGNVSQALSLIGEHACYHSMVAKNGEIYFLGSEFVYCSMISTWRERINMALSRGHKEALKLALTFYEGKAKAVVGLSSNSVERKKIVSDLMSEILVQYVDLSMTKLSPDSGKLQVLINFYRNVVPVCVDHCLYINRINVLFGRIYDRFKVDCIAHGAYLECLEPYILNDRLRFISPEVMKSFIDHYQSKNMLSNVENCLLHLDVTSLDLNQAFHLCWAHGLYDAIISLHNRSMKDFVGPLCELLDVLKAAKSSGIPLSDNMTNLGNKLLVYVNCCLVGLAYPSGNISSDTANNMRQQMFECLIQPTLPQIKSNDFYPIITSLLHFSTKEFLNVLSMAFVDPKFQGKKGFDKVQNLIDILLQVMLESPQFRPDQVGCLFTFLARQSAKEGSRLKLTGTLKQQVVEFLTSPADNATDHEEKQQALVELLKFEVLESENNSRLIDLAERASFYKVLRFLYTKSRRFDLVFAAHLKDPTKKENVFSYIKSILNTSNIDEFEKQQLRDKVLDHIKDLISINGEKSANLVTTDLKGSIQTISANLHDDPFVLYNFLQGCFVSNKNDSDEIIMESYFGEKEEISSVNQPTEPETCELYLSLMCQFNRSNVLNFIQECDAIRHHKALEITRRYRVDTATSYLLEEGGDITSAFNILLSSLLEKIRQASNVDEFEKLVIHEHIVKSSIDDVIRLCQRNSNKLLESQREKLWFALLDTTLKLPQFGKEDSENLKSKNIVHYVLSSMIGHVTISAVLQKIIQDPAFKTGNFGEIKLLLLGMLDTYRYERILLSTTLNLLARDRHDSLTQLKKDVTQGISPRSQICLVCKTSIMRMPSSNETIVVFSGGKAYHESCLKNISSMQNSRFETVRQIYEKSLKSMDYRDGMLFKNYTQHKKVKKNKDFPHAAKTQNRERTSSVKPSFDHKTFKLKVAHPKIEF